MMANPNWAHPKWQLKMEALQLKLNHASVMGDMQNMGKYSMIINKYSMIINKLWNRFQANRH